MELISPVKRDRMKKIAKLKLKKDMREALPVLNQQEIRRYRLAYYEAILIESIEDGYTSTSDFIKQLFQYQEDLIKEHGQESVVATRPQLKSSIEQLDLLYSGLKLAENAHYREDSAQEIDELIKMGALYGFGSINWWWLGEQLLIQANNVSSNFLKDGGKRNAIAKYIYGKFLYENLGDAEQAKEKLIIARQLSTGKSWNAKQELQFKQESIFIECCILLCKVLLTEARKYFISDPLKASRICVIARKRAADACDRVGEAEALMYEGLCEVQAGDSSSALRAFIKVLQLYILAENKEGICEARIYMGLAYLKIGKMEESLIQLNALLEYAQTHELPYYIAMAYRFLGEYYLNQGQPEEATPRLIQALKIFHEIEDFPNREQARNLAAVSAGQELLSKYLSLILKCGKRDTDVMVSLLKLLKWKDVREVFWDDVQEVESKWSLESEESVEIELNVEQMEMEMSEEQEEGYEDESDEIVIMSSDMDSTVEIKSIQSDEN